MSSVEDLLAGLSDSESDHETTPEPHVNLQTQIEKSKQLLDQANACRNKDQLDGMFEKCVEIDGPLATLENYAQQIYGSQFPELLSAVPSGLQFCAVVLLLGDDPSSLNREPAKEAQLENILGRQKAMSVKMITAEHDRLHFAEQEAQQLFESCRLFQQLYDARDELKRVALSRLEEYAPNLSQIISDDTIAEILAFTGGLKNLAMTSADNLPSLAANRMDKNVVAKHRTGAAKQGVLWHDPLFMGVHPDHMRSALRIVSGKIILAARMDLAKSSKDGAQGKAWRAYIGERLDKLGAPPPNQLNKALVIPEDKKSSRRGGKRARKYKEKYLMSELQRRQNRVSFGVDESKPVATRTTAQSQLHISKQMRARLLELSRGSTSK